MAPAPETIHASCVAVAGRGVLITGPSGSGKSALALELMSRGAGLVADDRTILTRRGAGLVASCPPALTGMIEARFVGLLAAAAHPPVQVALEVDLGTRETERLPPRRSVTRLDVDVPLLHDAGTGHFAAAILQYLLLGRLH
ncbi:HPr kinase/phosphorylase [Wenxinia marina]|uniref:Hpr(Ser) kinase/phosphatase n=1 Tax=Wenxinia marina DSM 24838 TaxID=1123501 RepID=A0A0D0PGZ9_9RHOB|nr:HPr kinase/phosphatase C-terminal domain-containing protein [Wenxinia marina]KIQ70611.1 Hpr(Ser) kinase/phosphatase [Wenxinia marina DSM 24838]GGL51763.1 aldolase [Wenxinia marina]